SLSPADGWIPSAVGSESSYPAGRLLKVIAATPLRRGPVGVAPLDRLLTSERHRERVTHVETFPARAAQSVAWPDWVSPALVEAYRACGVASPWHHQAAAA